MGKNKTIGFAEFRFLVKNFAEKNYWVLFSSNKFESHGIASFTISFKTKYPLLQKFPLSSRAPIWRSNRKKCLCASLFLAYSFLLIKYGINVRVLGAFR